MKISKVKMKKRIIKINKKIEEYLFILIKYYCLQSKAKYYIVAIYYIVLYMRLNSSYFII